MITAISGCCRWITISILLFISFDSNAGHILGTDISYSYSGTPNTYLVTVRWYRDCMGLPGSQQVTVCYNSVNAGLSNTATLQMLPGSSYFLPPFPYIPPMPTSCTGGSAPGIELLVYQGTVTLPSAQNDWILSYSTFPANIGIGQNFMYVSTKIDNLNYPTNSSSIYLYDPTFIYCINQSAWDNFASTDVDGDSLSYHLIPILDNDSPCPHAPFIHPIPAFPPLQSSSPITMDSTNGSLTFTPTQVGSAMVAARVDEFRNGVLINSTSRQHVMYLVTGCTITGINSIEESSVSLHPNPTSEILNIKMQNQTMPVLVDVIDVSGKIFSLPYSKKDNEIKLDVSSLSAGLYTLRITGKNSTTQNNFMIADK